MRLLFICTRGEHRSARAAEMYGGTARGIDDVTQEDLEADLVFVMEDEHRKSIAERFPEAYIQARIITLNIPDIYDKDSPELEQAIETTVEPWLE